METTTETKTRTITLTGRRPVEIVEDEWPIIASADECDHDGAVECQSTTNRRWFVWLKVRQHSDGRAIVYGCADYDSNYERDRNSSERAGALVAAGEDLAQAIQSVGRSLTGQDSGQTDRIGRVVRDCIADLPAETL